MPELRLRARALERDRPSPAVARLRRLRLSLTLLFTAAMAIGLAALALLVIHKDSEARLDSLEGAMGRRVSGASRLIYYSNRGHLRLDGLHEDDLTAGTPEVRVFDGTGAHPRQVFAGVATRPAVELRAAGGDRPPGEPGRSDVADDGHRLARHPGAAAGRAVLPRTRTVTRPARSSRPPRWRRPKPTHRELVATVVAGCAGLLLLAALGGYLLAGRSLRPAARSLAQQEALLADAAHELRTPVASIRATLEAAQLEPGRTEAAVEEARATSARMGDTLDALLAWARLEAGTEPREATELRLDQLVEDAVDEIGAAGRIAVDGRAVGRRRRPGPDPDRRAQPARQRAPPRQRCRGGRHRGDRRRGHGRGRRPRPGLAAAEAAGGIGRFRSGSPSGTGLGLSIAARVAELHGGELTSRDRPGGGTELVLSLAAAQPR